MLSFFINSNKEISFGNISFVINVNEHLKISKDTDDYRSACSLDNARFFHVFYQVANLTSNIMLMKKI